MMLIDKLKNIKKKIGSPHIRGIFFEDEHTSVYIERGFLIKKETFVLEVGMTDDIKKFKNKEISKWQLRKRLAEIIDWKFVSDIMDNFRDFDLEEHYGSFTLTPDDDQVRKMLAYDPALKDKITAGKMNLSSDELYELSPILRQPGEVKTLEQRLKDIKKKGENA